MVKKRFDIGNNLNVSSDIQAAIPWYGVVDPLTAKQGSSSDDFDFVYRNLLGAEPESAPQLDQQANPLTYINQRTVPFLILHGDQDVVVPVQDSQRLYQKLIDNKVLADLYQIKNAGHMDLKFLQPTVFKIIAEFLAKVL